MSPANHKNMGAKRLVGDILIASPLIMLCSIAFEARFSEPRFESYAYSDERQAVILSYADLVREWHSITALPRHERADRIRALATDWTKRIRHGEVGPLPKCNFLDSSRSGVKNEICVALDQFCAHLTGLAEATVATDPKQAATDYENALTILGSYKFSDLDSIGYIALRERTVLVSMNARIGSFAPEQRAALLTALRRIDVSQASVDRCIRMADRLYVIDGLRWGENRFSIFDPMARTQLNSPSIRQNANRLTMACLDATAYDQANTMQFALHSVDTERKELGGLQKKFAQLSR